MGNSILLDPFDVYQMSQGLHVPAAALFNGQLQLTPVDGIVLPAIAMTSDKDQCSFLNEAGRCSIHMFRPGFCRLFPLDASMTALDFPTFYRQDNVKNEHLAKVKVRQWINIPELKRYEQFVCDWHYFLKDLAKTSQGLSPELIKTLHSYILKVFYLTPYQDGSDFYDQFYMRLNDAKKLFL